MWLQRQKEYLVTSSVTSLKSTMKTNRRWSVSRQCTAVCLITALCIASRAKNIPNFSLCATSSTYNKRFVLTLQNATLNFAENELDKWPTLPLRLHFFILDCQMAWQCNGQGIGLVINRSRVLWAGKPSRYVTSHLGQLNLPSLRGR